MLGEALTDKTLGKLDILERERLFLSIQKANLDVRLSRLYFGFVINSDIAQGFP